MERHEALNPSVSRAPLMLLDDPDSVRPAPREPDLIRVCLVCGAELQDRSCKLVCRCGYFLSCSDYL